MTASRDLQADVRALLVRAAKEGALAWRAAAARARAARSGDAGTLHEACLHIASRACLDRRTGLLEQACDLLSLLSPPPTAVRAAMAGDLAIMARAIVLTKDDQPLVVGECVLLFSSFEKCDRARSQIPHLAAGMGKPIGDVWEFFALCHRRGLKVALDPVIANGALRNIFLAEAGTCT